MKQTAKRVRRKPSEYDTAQFISTFAAKAKKYIKAKPPNTDTSVYHEIILHPNEQHTIYPNALRWFQAGSDGAVISEFSTRNIDKTDIFTDKRIARETQIED